MRTLLLLLSAVVISGNGGNAGLQAAEITIATGSGVESPRQPQVAIGADRVAHVVYGIGEAVHYAASQDRGRTFSAPMLAFQCRNMSLGMRRGPRIAVSGTTVVATAIGGAQGKGRDGDLQCWVRSADGTWSAGARVNDVEGSAREGLHGMAAGPGGTLWCAWLDLRSQKTEVYASRSDDAGTTWSQNILVYRSPDGSVCECCHPSVAVDPQGQVSVLFRNSLKGRRDMYVASSKDGRTFLPASLLGTEPWKLDACPMDGGMLAVGADQQTWSTFRRQKQVFLASTEREMLLGPGEQPTLAAGKDGPVALWTNGRVGDLLVKTKGDKAPRRLSTEARDPVLGADLSGELVLAVWENVSGGDTSIRAAVLSAS